MKTVSKNVDGRYYPEFHFGWGGCAEELLHYTSRYYTYTEVFLRNLADQRQFTMVDYQARNLSEPQRRLMAAILAGAPDKTTARAVTSIVRSVRNGDSSASEELTQRYHEQLKVIPQNASLIYSERLHVPDLSNVAPLDPFLNLAKRLMLPVAVREHHVEVSLKELAQHLDSPNATLRMNLQEAILRVHMAGYIVRNHPGLTHETAKRIGDEDAV
jgi:hypothetical protein